MTVINGATGAAFFFGLFLCLGLLLLIAVNEPYIPAYQVGLFVGGGIFTSLTILLGMWFVDIEEEEEGE